MKVRILPPQPSSAPRSRRGRPAGRRDQVADEALPAQQGELRGLLRHLQPQGLRTARRCARSSRGTPASSPARSGRRRASARRCSRLAAEAPAPLFPSIRVCQLVGFLDARETRVGCLAPPEGDRRGRPPRAAASTTWRPARPSSARATRALGEREAALVEAATDFHLYGLVATDAAFVRAVLEGLAGESGGAIEPAELKAGAGRRGAQEALRAEGGARAGLGRALRGVQARSPRRRRPGRSSSRRQAHPARRGGGDPRRARRRRALGERRGAAGGRGGRPTGWLRRGTARGAGRDGEEMKRAPP